MDWIIIIGLLAATITTTSFLPQLIKSWKTKRTTDISLLTYVVLVIGLSLWLFYGILIKDLPLIIANSVTIILSGSVLFLKIKHK